MWLQIGWLTLLCFLKPKEPAFIIGISAADISPAPTTKSPTIESCSGYSTSTRCGQVSGCYWFDVRDCNALGKDCILVSYGCERTDFCGFNRGRYPWNQCGRYPLCDWSHNVCAPKPSPTSLPTNAPSASPTVSTSRPTGKPTLLPTTSAPTSRPSVTPSTSRPTSSPSLKPTFLPTLSPSFKPTFQPTLQPTLKPRAHPSFSPTSSPTRLPTQFPTSLSARPSSNPSVSPTFSPSVRPTTLRPTQQTAMPSQSPTGKLSRSPTTFPTSIPTFQPSKKTSKPSFNPVVRPTLSPHQSFRPSIAPTQKNRTRVTKSPTPISTKTPSQSPTISTRNPTSYPSATSAPTIDCSALSHKPDCVVNPQCEWLALNACDDSGKHCQIFKYGCRNYGFCDVNAPNPEYQQIQCNQRSWLCNWNNGTCNSACKTIVPPKRNACVRPKLSKSTPIDQALLFTGYEATDLSGFGLAGNGDLDGDGLPDFVIGSPGTPPKLPDRDGTGSVNVFLSSQNRTAALKPDFKNNVQLTPEYRLNGVSLEGQFGYRSLLVDLDGDSFDDLIVTAPTANIRRGEVFVFWGGPDFTANFGNNVYSDLQNSSCSQVLKINGDTQLMTFGNDIAKAGDFNGDGYQDVIIGSSNGDGPSRSSSGFAWILLGRPRSKFCMGNQSEWTTSTVGMMMKIIGKEAFSSFGTSVSGGADFNNDGYDDVIVGAPWGGRSSGIAGIGEVFIIFGRSHSTNVVDLLNDPHTLPNNVQNFMTIEGEADIVQGWSNLGVAVSFVGDVNNDGITDAVISAPNFQTSAGDVGRVYTIFGMRRPIDSLNAGDIGSASIPGFQIDGQGNFGTSLGKGFLDFNGDGIADILIGSPTLTKTGGSSVIIYGRCGSFPSVLNCGQISSVESVLFTDVNFKNFGSAVAVAGDINQDGITDFLAASYYSSGKRGQTFLVFSC